MVRFFHKKSFDGEFFGDIFGEVLLHNSAMSLSTLCLVSRFNIFSGCLHFDVFIKEVSQILLSKGQTLAKGAIWKMFDGLLMETWEIILAWKQVNSLAKWFS